MPQIAEQLKMLISIVIVGAILVGVLKVVLAREKTGESDFPYDAISFLFTPAERSFLGVIEQALDPSYRVFGKVRIADVMKVRKGGSRSNWQKAFNRIRTKHFDFVICRSSDCSIVLAIELDDKSHRATRRMERDDFVRKAAEAAELPLLQIPCRKSYSINEISSLLIRYLPDSPSV